MQLSSSLPSVGLGAAASATAPSGAPGEVFPAGAMPAGEPDFAQLFPGLAFADTAAAGLPAGAATPALPTPPPAPPFGYALNLPPSAAVVALPALPLPMAPRFPSLPLIAPEEPLPGTNPGETATVANPPEELAAEDFDFSEVGADPNESALNLPASPRRSGRRGIATPYALADDDDGIAMVDVCPVAEPLPVVATAPEGADGLAADDEPSSDKTISALVTHSGGPIAAPWEDLEEHPEAALPTYPLIQDAARAAIPSMAPASADVSLPAVPNARGPKSAAPEAGDFTPAPAETDVAPGVAVNPPSAPSGRTRNSDPAPGSEAPVTAPSHDQRIHASARPSVVEAAPAKVERASDLPGDEKEQAGIPAARGTAVRAANLAAVYGENLPRPVAETKGPGRSFLSVSRERVASDESELGTGVANSSPAMSTSTFQRHSTSDFGDHVSALATATFAGESPRQVTPMPAGAHAATAASAAQRAVNTVLDAADRFAAGNAQMVNLRFSVAGSDLAVRVEMRSGEVHVTFRSDSNELRTALAQEWQAVSSSEAGRPLRAIDPVFAPAKSTTFGGASGDSASHQHREPDARQSSENSRAPLPTLRVPAFFPSAEPSPRIVPLATALRLHAFA